MGFSPVLRFALKVFSQGSVWSQLKPIGDSEMTETACIEQREVSQRLDFGHPHSLGEGKEEAYKEH